MSTKTETVARLANYGMSPAEIERAMPGTPVESIRVVLSRLRRRNAIRPYNSPKSRTFMEVPLADDLHSTLETAAQLRGVTTEQLATSLLSIILWDGMLTAVLDDDVPGVYSGK